MHLRVLYSEIERRYSTTSSERICRNSHAVALKANIENTTLNVTLSIVPMKKAIPQMRPIFAPMSSAAAAVPRSVPAKYAATIERNSPTDAMILLTGFFAARATRKTRNGAMKKAATVLIG